MKRRRRGPTRRPRPTGSGGVDSAAGTPKIRKRAAECPTDGALLPGAAEVAGGTRKEEIFTRRRPENRPLIMKNGHVRWRDR